MPVRIFRHYVQLPVLILGAVEAVLLIVSVYAGAALRHAGSFEPVTAPLWPRGLAFAAVVITCMVAMGLYQARVQTRKLATLIRLVASFVLGGAALALLFYVFPALYLGRGILAFAFSVAFVMLVGVRLLALMLVDEKLFRRRTLIYGAGQKAASLLALRGRADRAGFVVVGCIRSSGDADAKVDAERILEPDRHLGDFALALNVEEIVVAIDDRRRGLPVQELLDCKLRGIQVIDAITFFERESGKVKLDLLYPSWMIFSDGFSRGRLRDVAGRAFDVVASIALLLLTWPIMLLVALAIMLEDGRPVFYRQTRVGHEAKVFQVMKFRSMRTDAEKDGVAKWAEKNDSRVTRVGSVIRKYRIDELPQIFNVLRGEMSFVGPRPERPDFVDELSQRIPYYRERHCVKPGITGWAQLCYAYGASHEDALEKLQYDLYYVKNHSLLFDLMILLQTVEVVLWRTGAR